MIGTALGLISSGWLTRFAELMVLLGSILVPVGGVFLAHFVLLKRPIDIVKVYDRASMPAFNIAGIGGVGRGIHRLPSGRADRRDPAGAGDVDGHLLGGRPTP